MADLQAGVVHFETADNRHRIQAANEIPDLFLIKGTGGGNRLLPNLTGGIGGGGMVCRGSAGVVNKLVDKLLGTGKWHAVVGFPLGRGEHSLGHNLRSRSEV